MYSAPAAISPAFGSRARPEVILEDTDDVPTYYSRFQSDFAGAESAPTLKRRQLDFIGDGTRPLFQSVPVGSRLRVDDIYEGRGPGYTSHAQDGFASAEQVFGFEPRRQIPTSKKPIIGEMVGPKRKAQPPPNQETSQQGTSGAIKIAPIVKSSEKWQKKWTLDNCPVIEPNGESFIELRCYRCHCNASGVTGKFWRGGRGIQGHLRKKHEETLTPAETLARCCIRSVSADEVKRIESGELVIEKVFYYAFKKGTQDEGDAEREGDDEDDDEDDDEEDDEEKGEEKGEEQEEEQGEEEARPVKTRKRHTKPRDFSLGKLRSTTW